MFWVFTKQRKILFSSAQTSWQDWGQIVKGNSDGKIRPFDGEWYDKSESLRIAKKILQRVFTFKNPNTVWKIEKVLGSKGQDFTLVKIQNLAIKR